MSYAFIDGCQYIMPTHFGPMTGPRNSPNGTRFPRPDCRRIEILELPFRTEEGAIRDLLPPGFELMGEPIVTIVAVYMANIAWLAGRGYNTLGVTAPVRYIGERDTGEGVLQLVLWENLPEAILTGREQLGFSKLYCELPQARLTNREMVCTANWQGHRFCELKISDLKPSPARMPPKRQASANVNTGILNLRYVPAIDDNTRPHLVETSLTPFLEDTPNLVEERLTGTAAIRFYQTTWEDMPTQYRIVEGLRALPIIATMPASYVRGIGACDAINTRVLR